MKVQVRISDDGVTGVARKTFDHAPTRKEIEAVVDAALAQRPFRLGQAKKAADKS